MGTSLGRITARLLQPIDSVSAEFIDLINRNINPPTPVGKDDIYIRAMYIVSDQVNSFGGCFPVEEHARLAELLVDSPVMVGHRKDSLPIARNFYARSEEKNSRNWVKSYFYWLKSARGAEDLKENIDGGIYKECSIGFTYLFPECSVCGKDIRSCEHEPFGKYHIGGKETECHFNYRRIERVLETSLVYRGALPDTGISRELKIEKINNPEFKQATLEEISTLEEFADTADNRRYLLVPRYEAIPVSASFENDRLILSRDDGKMFPEELAGRFSFDPAVNIKGQFTTPARLVGYRGKERCRVKYLEKFLNDRSGPVTRVELKMFPHEQLSLNNDADSKSTFNLRIIPHRLVLAGAINNEASQIMTQAGVEIWPLVDSRPVRKGYLYRPVKNELSVSNVYTFTLGVNETDSRLTLRGADIEDTYTIHQFNFERLNRGGCF
ncbi:MAG: hypothetical protein ACOYVF_01145, partial [Candidatus Zixiibacteriota bacterium]